MGRQHTIRSLPMSTQTTHEERKQMRHVRKKMNKYRFSSLNCWSARRRADHSLALSLLACLRNSSPSLLSCSRVGCSKWRAHLRLPRQRLPLRFHRCHHIQPVPEATDLALVAAVSFSWLVPFRGTAVELHIWQYSILATNDSSRMQTACLHRGFPKYASPAV